MVVVVAVVEVVDAIVVEVVAVVEVVVVVVVVVVVGSRNNAYSSGHVENVCDDDDDDDDDAAQTTEFIVEIIVSDRGTPSLSNSAPLRVVVGPRVVGLRRTNARDEDGATETSWESG